MKFNVSSGVLAILGILLIVAPWTFAPVCEVNGDYVQTTTGKLLPMPCGYTARAEIGIGALVLVTGMMMGVAQSTESKKFLGAFGISLGAVAILLPTYLIGMCANASHSCRLLTQPVLILVGIAIVITGFALIAGQRKG